jgi:hypothetical protein
MWNLSYRWQRRTRVVAGAVVLVSLVAGAAVVANTSAASRTWKGTREVVNELRAGAEQRVDVMVPADLHARPGTLVYLDRKDGVAQVVGRVVEVGAVEGKQVPLKIHLMSSAEGAAGRGGVLKGTSASLDLRDAVRLLISPNTPNEEVLRARDSIWPSVSQNVLPAMTDNLIREVTRELSTVDEEDKGLVASTIESLYKELKPLENQLMDRLARRAWDVVGVKGLAAGIWRTTAGGVQRRSVSMTDWFWQLLGSKNEEEPAEPPFLSDETREALRTALKNESLEFWKEHRTEIIETLMRVVAERRPDFESAFSERWAGVLYERAVMPAWEAGQDKVLESVQDYANDFATRRLLTSDNGPRLLFAFALRSSLKISDDPLLVFAPQPGIAPGALEYESLLR